jgi:Xaa-Pro aminopeptidase
MPSDLFIASSREVQSAAKSVLDRLGVLITQIDSERTIAAKAYALLCESGYSDTWYYNCPAFVLLGTRSCISISGRDYVPSDETVGRMNLITVDLSPEKNGFWGDCARSFYIENGVIAKEPVSAEFIAGKQFLHTLHFEMKHFVNPDLTFHELFEWSNSQIQKAGFSNLDFLGNVGHSIATSRQNRQYIERANMKKLSEVPFFTFEPHVRFRDGKWGFKHENIFYFDGLRRLQEL